MSHATGTKSTPCGTQDNREGLASAEAVLEALQQLPVPERLRVIAAVLPETTRQVVEHPVDEVFETLERALRPLEALVQQAGRINRLRSLHGLWRGMGFDVSEREIDDARREAWATFPREDV